jgi:hypothetical protein
MSLLYSDLPVYVGAANASSVTESSAYVPALSANVNFNAQLQGKRFLGQDVTSTDQFKTAGAREATISINSVLDPFADSAFAFAKSSNQDAFFPIRIGNNTYQKCYLNSFSLSVDNFAPVTMSANFVSLDPPTGGNISGDATPYGGSAIPFDSDDIVYGYTCSISNPTQAVGNVQYTVNYAKNFSRTAVYNLGAANASSMLLDSVESEMTIESTGLSSLIDFSGGAISSSVVLSLKNIDGTALSTNLPNVGMLNGSRVVTQSYNIEGSDTVNTRAAIKQIDL